MYNPSATPKEAVHIKMTRSNPLVPHQLSLSNGNSLPPSLPLIISSQDNWNPLSCQLETPAKPDSNSHTLKLVPEALELLQTIDKPLAVLSICGPYRSGKSCFISRVLGSPGALKLGHSMQACTRGIWMFTTVLECQDFTILVLDTEGIDAVGVSETFAMSLLTLTTLFSSFLIYNSKKVPQKMDLDKMRYSSQLPISLLVQCGMTMSTETRKAFLPQLLWLLRDVTIKMTDGAGKEIEPTEFLHTKLLASESGALTALGKSLVDLFPSLECATLPIPSIKRDIICNIVDQQDKLKPAFNTAVDSLVQQILNKVSPKKAVDGSTTVNGKALAVLAESYVEAVNRPGAIPDLDQGWQAVVRLELKEVLYRLVREYEREMEEALEGDLPMEESNLLRIHLQSMKQKKKDLREEICHIDPLNSSDEEVEPLLEELERDIVQWSKEEIGGGRRREVVGGVLYQFTTTNFFKSKEQCENLLMELIEINNVEEDVQNAVCNFIPIDIRQQVSQIANEYLKRAVGPAAGEVLDRGLCDLNKLDDILKNIPGLLQYIWHRARRNEIKLYWTPPKRNPEAVDEYVVLKRNENGEWKECARTKETKVIVKGLKTNTRYSFQIAAVNDTLLGCFEDTHVKTNISFCKEYKVARILSVIYSPFILGALASVLLEDHKCCCKDAAVVAFTIATLPIGIALMPVTIPIMTCQLLSYTTNDEDED